MLLACLPACKALSLAVFHTCFFFFFQAEDGIRDWSVTGVQTCALPISAMAGNPLAVKLAADQGVTIGWTDWALAAFGPGFLCLIIIPLALLWLAPPE